MTALAFIVPAYRRFDLTRACLSQLRRTCDELELRGIKATAVVIGDDANLDVADMLGFGTVRRENRPLGRKFNDGIEAAAQLGCEHVIPFGTDNWIDPDLIVGHLPREGTIRAHRLITLVHESGEKMAPFRISYVGGDGIRIIPLSLLEPLRYRPADDDRNRAIDTSMRDRLGRITPLQYEYHDIDSLQIVGFQSEDQQLNTYRDLRAMYGGGNEDFSPWETLARRYPQESVDEVREVFMRRGAKVLA